MCPRLNVGSRMEPPNNRAHANRNGIIPLKPEYRQATETNDDIMKCQTYEEFQRVRMVMTDQRRQTSGCKQTNGERPAADRPTATDQRLQNGRNKPTVLDQIGQQKSVQKVPQEQQFKLKWSPAKRDAVSFRAFLGIKHTADPLSWGTNDELEALAKMYNVQFMVFETAQAVESQWISIGEDDSPKICLYRSGQKEPLNRQSSITLYYLYLLYK